jgi:transcriptional regulator with XRE-family HTH domain
MNRLKKRRQMSGLTQHRLHVLTKIPLGRITYFESGRIRLTPDELQRIEQALAARAKEIARMVDDPGRALRSARLRSESREVA